MNICMVAYTFYESDNRVRRYAETLAKLDYIVDVVALRKPDQSKFETINDVNVNRIQIRKVNEKGKRTYLYRLLKFLLLSTFWLAYNSKKKYKLIHVHSVPDFEVFATVIPKLRDSKIILDIHDIVPEFYAEKFGVNLGHPVVKMLKTIEKLCCSYVDHVIIANDIWREKLINRAVIPEKCTTIMNYPDTSIFSYKSKSKSKSDKTIMIYPGTLAYHQGVDIAIKASQMIREKIPDFEFHIYGKGPKKKELLEQIEQSGLKEFVFIHEQVSMEMIADKLSESDIGVVPKRASGFGNEGLSTKIFEYMATGLPVVASRTKVDAIFPENSVSRFESEKTRELADQVIKLILNPDVRNSQLDAANNFIKEQTWDKKKDIYLNIIDYLLEK